MLFRCDGYPLHVKSTKIKYLFRARARAPVVCAESSIAPVVCAESSIAPFIRFDLYPRRNSIQSPRRERLEQFLEGAGTEMKTATCQEARHTPDATVLYPK